MDSKGWVWTARVGYGQQGLDMDSKAVIGIDVLRPVLRPAVLQAAASLHAVHPQCGQIC